MTNSIDSINVSCIVQVLPLLQQVYYTLSPRHWPLNHATPFVASVFVGDPNPGPINITWDFGDGTFFSGPRLGKEVKINKLIIDIDSILSFKILFTDDFQPLSLIKRILDRIVTSHSVLIH